MTQNANSAASATEKKIGYSSEADLIKELKRYLTDNPAAKDIAANYLYHSLIEDMILGVALEVHYAARFGLIDYASEQQPENCLPYSGENSSIFNVFDQNPQPKKKTECVCICSHCQRTVNAFGFAPHLQKCMGMQTSRQASRLASRRRATGESTTYYGDHASDDDNVGSSDKKIKKRNNSNIRSNGSKRNGKPS